LTIKASMSDNFNHSPLNNSQLKKTVFDVPDGYFDNLSDRIKAGVEFSESKLMEDSLLKKNIFQTPDQYFEQLSGSILSRLEEKEEVKVLPMYQTTWFKYAAAAVILCGVLIFGLRNTPTNENMLAEISDQAIIDYLEEKQAIEYDLLSSVTDLTGILDDMIAEETSSLSFASNENPELEYEFEYLDY
jgi:hypothetical protein